MNIENASICPQMPTFQSLPLTPTHIPIAHIKFQYKYNLILASKFCNVLVQVTDC